MLFSMTWIRHNYVVSCHKQAALPGHFQLICWESNKRGNDTERETRPISFLYFQFLLYKPWALKPIALPQRFPSQTLCSASFFSLLWSLQAVGLGWVGHPMTWKIAIAWTDDGERNLWKIKRVSCRWKKSWEENY